MMIQRIATNSLAELYNEDGIVLLDCRPSAAYNGWVLQGEARGGHIPHAVSFPLNWFQELEYEQVKKKLSQKDITETTPILVTGYGQGDIHKTAHHLQDLGFRSVKTHTEGMVDWASNPRRPVQSLPRFRHLIHPEWLRQLLTGSDPESGGAVPYILAHVNFDNWGDYDEGHIPGAIWLDTLLLEDDLTWNCRTAEELEKELRLLGITRDTVVILYGRTSNPNMSQAHPGKQAGQLASMRAALLLMYAGIRDVRVLDGGLDAWVRAGGSVTREETLPAAVKHTGLHIPEHPEYLIDIQKAKQLIADANAELVSMRSWAEFTGEVSGYHYIQQTGRIPGAVFGNNGSDAYNMENYRNHDDTMRNFHEIAQLWRDIGIVPEKHIAFYCGTGWRASESFFCAWLMGWERISVYDGGWYEWSSDPDNPIETGIPHSHSDT
jgi:3-mercaptopyruvate sulfurtransferase SseA